MAAYPGGGNLPFALAAPHIGTDNRLDRQQDLDRDQGYLGYRHNFGGEWMIAAACNSSKDRARRGPGNDLPSQIYSYVHETSHRLFHIIHTTYREKRRQKGS